MRISKDNSLYHNCTDRRHDYCPLQDTNPTTRDMTSHCWTSGLQCLHLQLPHRMASAGEQGSGCCTVKSSRQLQLQLDVWRGESFSCTGYSAWAARHPKTKAPQPFETMGTDGPKTRLPISEETNPSADNFQHSKTSTASTRYGMSAFCFAVTDLSQYHLLPPD